MSGVRAAGSLLAVLALAGAASAELRNGALGSAAAATDYYQVTCSDDGSGPPASLIGDVLDASPAAAPLVSLQIRKGTAAISSTDPVDGDASPCPAVWINGGAGLYHVLVDKSGSGGENYTLSVRCMTGNGGTGVVTGTTVVGLSAPPGNGIDCSVTGGCSVTKYGLHAADSYRRLHDPLDPLQWTHTDFAGSYVYDKASPDPADPGCLGERDFAPIFGQFLIREQTLCVPTVSTGCPVEFAADLANPANPLDPNRSFFGSARTTYSSLVQGGTAVRLWLGFALDGVLEGRGTRFAMPGSSQTRIAWDEIQVSGDDGNACCNDDSGLDLCNTLGGGTWARYPLLNDLSSMAARRIELPDWIFAGGAGTPFATDLGPVVQGQVYGVCAAHRDWGCTASGTGCSGTEPCDCTHDRCDPATHRCSATPAVACTSHADCRGHAVADVCDLRELGWRLGTESALPDGQADPERCGAGMYVFRGTPGRNCSLVRRYAIDGDPGPSCAIANFGSSMRPDQDCNGADDQVPDRCPYYSELDPFADANADGRGDECECGDSAPLVARRDGSLAGRGDGRIDVSDLVATNVLIFSSPGGADWDLQNPRCDSDAPAPLTPGYRGKCTVSDIVATNAEIFSPGATARCARALAPAAP